MTLDWFDGLCDAIESLAEFPDRCALAPEPILRQKGVRQLLYGGGTAILAVAAHGRDARATSRGHAVYRILYLVTDDTVQILTIRHAHRKPPKG